MMICESCNRHQSNDTVNMFDTCLACGATPFVSAGVPPTVDGYTVRTREGLTMARVRLVCPNGHEVVSAPTTNSTGLRLSAGDFSREDCGNTSCDWNGATA